jgi:putative spermidine/putrescine transport system permease protein
MGAHRDLSEIRISTWNVVPSVFVLAVFFSAFAVFFYTSLLHRIPGEAAVTGPADFSNYIRYFGSSVDLRVLADTLLMSAELTLLSLLLGYPLAYVIVRAESSLLRGFLLLSLVVTFLSGTVTRAYAWLIILGNNGLVNTVLKQAGIIDSPLKLVYNKTGVIIALLHFALPFFVLTMLGPLKNVPRVLEESAINLGASRLQAFFRVTLPLSVPGIVAACSLTFAVALGSFLFPMVLGGGRVRFVSNAIYELIFTSFDIPFAAATATVFLVVSLFFVWAFSAVQRVTATPDRGD